MWQNEIIWVAKYFNFKILSIRTKNGGERVISLGDGNRCYLKCEEYSLLRFNVTLMIEREADKKIETLEELFKELGSLPRFVKIR